MKQQIIQLISLIVVILLSVSLATAQTPGRQVDITTATEQNLATVDVTATGKSYGPDTLSVNVKSQADETLTVTIPQGLWVKSVDPIYSDQIVATSTNIENLGPGETQTVQLDTFNGHAYRAIPVQGAQYQIGNMVDSWWLQSLLDMIKDNPQGLTPDEQQWSIWTLTDNFDGTPPVSSAVNSGSAVSNFLSSGSTISSTAVQSAISTAGGLWGLLLTYWWIPLLILLLLLLLLFLWWLLSRRGGPSAVDRPKSRTGFAKTSRESSPRSRGSDVTHGRD